MVVLDDGHGLMFILMHDGGVPGNVGKHDGRELAGLGHGFRLYRLLLSSAVDGGACGSYRDQYRDLEAGDMNIMKKTGCGKYRTSGSRHPVHGINPIFFKSIHHQ